MISPQILPFKYPSYSPSLEFEYELDSFDPRTIAAAYGLRRLRYDAKLAIRVRRSSDNAVTDIGFVGENLDIASILAFVGSGNGFIDTWWDQSGNGNHAIQTIIANQPRIANTGILDVDAIGRPIIKTIASTTRLDIVHNDIFNADIANSIFVVHNPSTLGGGSSGRIVDTGSIAPFHINVGANNVIGSCRTSSNNGIVDLNAMNMNSVTFDLLSNATKFYKKGTLDRTTATTALVNNSTNMYLFNSGGGDRGYDGSISEILLLTIVATDAQRQYIERNQGKYYSISVA